MKHPAPFLTHSLGIVAIFSAVCFWMPGAQANPVIESIDGEVRIQRGRLRLRPVPNETVIEPRDIVHIGGGGQIGVLCTPEGVELNRQFLSGPTRSGVRRICDNSKELERDSCTTSSEFMEGRSSEVPYIITPRNGTVLDSDILFRWNPVDSAQSYTVRLETPTSPTEWTTIWTVTTTDTHIPYTGEVDLRPDVPYTLVVETDTGISSVENQLSPFSRSFSVIDNTEKLETVIANIQTQTISEEDIALATVAAYTCHEPSLVNNAINYLERAISATGGSPPLFQALGDLYYGSGLALLAQENYRRAVESADLNIYLEEWIAAQEGLARVYRRTDRAALATSTLQQAELGAYYTCDYEALERIAESLTALSAIETAAETLENEPTESISVEPLECEVSFE